MRSSVSSQERKRWMNEICLTIGDINCALTSFDELLISELKNRFYSFLSENEPDIVLEIHFDPDKPSRFYRSTFMTRHLGQIYVSFLNAEASVDICSKRGNVTVASPRKQSVFALGVFLAALYYLLLTEKGGILLHASASARNNKGYIFFGPSGSGKSTISELLGGQVFNDDRVALRIAGKEALVFNTPFWDRSQFESRSEGVPVKALCILQKDSQCCLERVSPRQAISSLMGELFSDPFSAILGGHVQLRTSLEAALDRAPRNHKLSRAIFEQYCKLVQIIPTYNLHFTRNASEIWRCLDAVE